MAGLEPSVRVFQDSEALARGAAEVFVDCAHQAVIERRRFLVAFSGGRTPGGLYTLLSAPPYREEVEWGVLHAFWADERCVPPEDLENNYGMLEDLLLRHVPVPPENIHRVRTELDAASAAQDYALVLKKWSEPPLEWPRLDLVLLGLGADGHTASLFPGSRVTDHEPVGAVRNARDSRPSGLRITMSPLVLNSARRVIFLVVGSSKAQAVADVLYGAFDPERLPAQRIKPTDGELVWMLDAEAAHMASRED